MIPDSLICMENMLMRSVHTESKSEARFVFSICVYLDSASKNTDLYCHEGIMWKLNRNG